MIQINKVGNAIVIKFTDNDKYLFNGTIEVAPNELMVVVDLSNMVTFKKMSNGDTLFGQSYEKIRINDEPVTKENIVEKFATIGFTSGGGGGTGGAVDSVNGLTGTVIITASSLGAMTKETADATYQPIGDYAVKSDLSTLATKSELNTKQDTLVSGQNIKTINGESVLGEGNIAIQGGASNWNDIQGKPEFAEVATSGSYNDLTDKPEIPSDYIENITDSDTEFSIDTAFNYKSGKKYSLSFSKTGGFDVIIGGVGDTQRNINLSIDTDIIATKGDLANYQPVGDYATKTELASKQDTLVSGTSIKTVNGLSLLGNGNIQIEGGGTITVDTSLSTTSENPVQNKVITNAINGKLDKGDYALKSEIPDVSGLATKEELAAKLDTATYNSEKANFATKDELNSKADASAIADMATKTWVGEQGYLTEIPAEYITETELNGKGYATTAQLANKVDVSTYTEDKATFATKDELNLKANTSDLSNYLQTSVADEKYATKTELEGKVDDADIADMLTKSEAASTYQPKGEYATTSQLSGKQDTLVSGTNIKTVNGNSLLGEGDITIQSGGGVGQTYPDSTNGEIFNDYEGNQASGRYSHAEGYKTTTSGTASHAEGYKTTSGSYSHAEGDSTTANGTSSHAEGNNTTASGNYAHAEGYQTKATLTASHAEGYYTKTNNKAEHSQGQYNKSNTGATDDLKTLHSIGIGENEEGRKNAQEVMTNGDHYIIGIGGYDGTNPEAAQTLQEVVNSGGSSVVVDTEMSDTSENAVQNKVIKAYIDSLVGNILTQLQEINGTN